MQMSTQEYYVRVYLTHWFFGSRHVNASGRRLDCKSQNTLKPKQLIIFQVEYWEFGEILNLRKRLEE